MNYISKALRQYMDFEGRARRREYWYFLLFFYLVIYLSQSIMPSTNNPLPTVVIILFLIPYLALSARRMHDVGKSGWYILVPIYNLVMYLTPGEVGPNQYGPDPKEGEHEIEDFEEEEDDDDSEAENSKAIPPIGSNPDVIDG